jgi:Ca2+-binding EF-hand superfamily protein
MFKILDNNGNRQIDMSEFYWGLKDLGISITEEDAQSVLTSFDTDGSGAVDFDEFLRVLRGDLNSFRINLIKKAYQKLDVNGDGTVKLDDIAQLYDVSKHAEVISGRKQPKDAYLDFMRLWDTQVADGIVTFEEFLDYFKDVSASIDTDEYFGVLMKNAWKLDA